MVMVPAGQPIPRTRVRVGRTLGRRDGWQAVARGCVTLQEGDAATPVRNAWEEWHLRDAQDVDHRLAYHYGTGAVMLSRPEQVPETLDPRTLREGEEVVVTLDGRPQRLRVDRAAVAEVFHVVGEPTPPLRVGDPVAHAELHGPDVVLTVQDAGRGVEVHRGTVLDKWAQKAVLGRDVGPRMNRFLVAAGWAAVFVLLFNLLNACMPDDLRVGAAGAVRAVVVPAAAGQVPTG
ncbi:DUF4178 domain-containing protein [Cellulomonas wangsupingiae]|uniref:DUF4178 domain-containing protein n=1 Tax=Cellulomonas wangsupingiae TaxID=2968085 RepID=UPI001D0DC404|nr:DUF4178 domain-containing protein [Cellulomonas wangsupingiae]MCM0640134.1 DUF4178 domain-containing protein [Cellulomonas wangsupingiae]